MADHIGSSLKGVQSKDVTLQYALSQIEENVAASKTILSCAQHQKRILDDVLTISKLDFEMLPIMPTPVQPKKLIAAAVKMFEAESASHDIKMIVSDASSVIQNPLQVVQCDDSRVTQILINILSNAIKFTKSEPRREVKVRWGISQLDPQHTYSSDVHWASLTDTEATLSCVTFADFEAADIHNLIFEITDSGAGMNADEMSRLFHRFSQGTSKTSIKYGGKQNTP